MTILTPSLADANDSGEDAASSFSLLVDKRVPTVEDL